MFTRTRASSRLRLTGVMTCLIIAVCTAYVGAQEPIVRPQQVTKWDKTTDICIVGFGLAGASAAIEAKRVDPGASVLVLEKMDKKFSGGNTRASGQTILIPDPKDVDKFTAYIKACNEPNSLPDEYLDWMINQWTTELLPFLEEVAASADYEVGYVGGGPLRWQKVTEFEDLPGSDFNACSASLRAKGSLGFEVGGVMNGFEKAVWKLPVEIMYETPAIALVQDPLTTAVVGVIAKKANGETIAIRANKGVILACGGHSNNMYINQNFWGADSMYTCGTPANTGDALPMLMAAGAKMWHMRNQTQSGGNWLGIKVPDFEATFIREFSMKGKSWIEVAADSTRFYDESRSYHRQHEKYKDFGAYVDLRHWQLQPTHLIFDEATRKAGPIVTGWLSWPITTYGYKWSKDNSVEVTKGWIVKADTIEELAAKINRDPKALKATIDKWNSMCATGKDSEYGRDPKTMSAILAGPFYAVEIVPTLVATTGGAERNTNSQVLSWSGKPIPRLYEAGELGAYIPNLYQNGTFLADAIFSGRAAAKHALTLEPLQ